MQRPGLAPGGKAVTASGIVRAEQHPPGCSEPYIIPWRGREVPWMSPQVPSSSHGMGWQQTELPRSTPCTLLSPSTPASAHHHLHSHHVFGFGAIFVLLSCLYDCLVLLFVAGAALHSSFCSQQEVALSLSLLAPLFSTCFLLFAHFAISFDCLFLLIFFSLFLILSHFISLFFFFLLLCFPCILYLLSLYSVMFIVHHCFAI